MNKTSITRVSIGGVIFRSRWLPMCASVVAGDPSPDGNGVLAIHGHRGGAVFTGLPYPQRMNLQFTDEQANLKSC